MSMDDFVTTLQFICRFDESRFDEAIKPVLTKNLKQLTMTQVSFQKLKKQTYKRNKSELTNNLFFVL